MQIGLGVGVTRLGVAEQITGLWSFLHAQGLLTDDIGERTAAHGVEIDGLLVKDAGVPAAAVTAHEAALAILESQIADGTILARLAAAETVAGSWTFTLGALLGANLDWAGLAAADDAIWVSSVSGDSQGRFLAEVGGKLEWGDGAGARDTNLFRAAADALRTDDEFQIGGSLNILAGQILSSRTPGAFTVNKNDFSTGVEVLQRLENSSGSMKTISGFAGGASGRVIIIRIVDASFQVDLLHQNGGSAAANRMMLPAGATFSITGSQAITLWYDGALARWIPLSASS